MTGISEAGHNKDAVYVRHLKYALHAVTGKCVFICNTDNHAVYHSPNFYTMQKTQGKLNSVQGKRCGVMTYHLLMEQGMDQEEEYE